MDIFKQLRGNAIVEANNLTGLRNGHMVAQAAFVKPEGATKLENGVILQLNKDNKLELATGHEGAFLHYSEEHMKFLDSASLDMFYLPLGDEEVYPRAVALYEGDTFTTDKVENIAEATSEYKPVTVEDGVLKFDTGVTNKGPIAKAATLPNGKKAIEVVWRGGAL